MHHVETLITDESRVKREKEKVSVHLRNCGYLEWALKEGEQLGKRQKGGRNKRRDRVRTDKRRNLTKLTWC